LLPTKQESSPVVFRRATAASFLVGLAAAREDCSIGLLLGPDLGEASSRYFGYQRRGKVYIATWKSARGMRSWPQGARPHRLSGHRVRYSRAGRAERLRGRSKRDPTASDISREFQSVARPKSPQWI